LEKGSRLAGEHLLKEGVEELDKGETTEKSSNEGSLTPTESSMPPTSSAPGCAMDPESAFRQILDGATSADVSPAASTPTVGEQVRGAIYTGECGPRQVGQSDLSRFIQCSGLTPAPEEARTPGHDGTPAPSPSPDGSNATGISASAAAAASALAREPYDHAR